MWFRNKTVVSWHEGFVSVARQVFAQEDLSFELALVALRGANGSQLLDFDHRARRGMGEIVRSSGDRSSVVLKMALSDPHHADVFLFYGSCSGNGYIREQALRALRGHRGRLACAAALLRTEDWVPQVAEIASRLLHDVAETDTARYFFELFDLINTLQTRQRFRPHWSTTLEPLLLLPKWRAAREQAFSSRKAIARRMAHALSLRADARNARESLRVAIGDLTPLVALWALSQLKDSVDAPAQRELLAEGLRSRLAAVRTDALRRYCRAGFDDVRERLRAAILDNARSVRGVAAYQLKQLFDESALERWRILFDAGQRDEAIVASLSDFGDAEDASRLRTQLTHPRSRLRAVTLRGLIRVGVTDSGELLSRALRDKSAQVVGVATGAYARGIDQLNIATLRDALGGTEVPRLRARLISASRGLRKWDRLEFLLSLYPRCLPTDVLPLDAAVQRWIAKANHGFTRVSPGQQEAIRHALEVARKMHPAPFWPQVSHLI
jgi:hypothetical protein